MAGIFNREKSVCLAEVSVMEQILRKFPNSQNPSGTEHAQTVCTRLFFLCPRTSLGTRLQKYMLIHGALHKEKAWYRLPNAMQCVLEQAARLYIPAGLKTTFKRLTFFFFVSHVKSKHYDRPISFCGTIVGTS